MIKSDIFLCPVCKNKLIETHTALLCENGHCFDKAKEGYVNLLLGNKSGAFTGDNREMALNRKAFLNKGYYHSLAKGVTEILNSQNGCKTVLDVCCGEGYYSDYAKKTCPESDFYGFDISKEMIRLAAKRKADVSFFVANMTSLPIADKSIDVAFELFAPLSPAEINRVIKPGGSFIYATGGKNHLMGLKKAVYDTPYFNEEINIEINGFTLQKTVKINDSIKLCSNSDIVSLFKMTPYFYHTPAKGIRRLEHCTELITELCFTLNIYRKDGV